MACALHFEKTKNKNVFLYNNKKKRVNEEKRKKIWNTCKKMF